MADAEHDGIDEELFQYAIQQSLRDTCRRNGDAHSKG
jgi:hypothetical protein